MSDGGSTDAARYEGSQDATPRVRTRGEEETVLLGRLLGGLVRGGDVIALAGPLGAGKTCLTHGIAGGMGIVEPVPSPTFNLLLVHAGEPPLFHFDLYRLERASQLEDIDFYETIEGPGVSVIEWADRFADELPDEHLAVTLVPSGEDERVVVLDGRGTRAAHLVEHLIEAWEHACGPDCVRDAGSTSRGGEGER